MQKLEELKQELIKQKGIIEKKGGKITVANNNPSPSEITAGINSIISSDIDFSLANATNDDVKKGKTYYNNMAELQTGNYEDLAYTLFLYNVNEMDKNKQYEFVVPEYMKNMRDSLFYNFPCKLNVTLDPNTTIIPRQALYSETGDITLTNFDELTKLTEIGEYGLARVKGIDFTSLPSSLTTFDKYCLQSCYYGQTSIKLSSTIKSCLDGCFSSTKEQPVTLTNLDMTKYSLNHTASAMFKYVYVDQDFTFPNVVTGIADYTFEEGGVKKVTFHKNVNAIGARCFYNSSDINFTQQMVFLGEKPPYVNTSFLSGYQVDVVKVYVPENSCAEYKKELLMDNVFPLSQMP